jgi:hypothetical protein
MNMSNFCYFCGGKATTDEHCPPKAIFPKLKDSPDGRNYRTNPIIVRSCEEHNTERAKDDEYLLYVLVMNLPSNEIAKSQFLTRVRRAIERRPSLLKRLMIETQEVVIHDTVTDKWEKSIAIKPEEQRLVRVFTSIAKALYFHEKGRVWPGRVSIVTEFMLSFDDIGRNERQEQLVKALDAFLANVPHKGQHPDVFSYQFLDIEGRHLLRLHFFGNSRVSATFL